MDSNEDPIHVIIRLPFARPEGYVDTQPVVWTESMEKTLWQLIGQTKPSLVDWNAVSRQLGNVPVPFLIRHATQLYQTQLQDLHRIGEQQQELTALSRPSSRSIVGTSNSQEGTIGYLASSRTLPTAKENEPLSSGSSLLRDRDLRIVASGSTTVHGQDSTSKAQASPSLSGSITSFPVSGKPASMSSSASTIRPANPSSPAPSLRSTPSSQQQTSVDVNPYSSGIMASRGSTQPRSTRSSQLIGSVLERRPNPAIAPPNLPTSPRDDNSPSEILRRISEPSHPFHKATLSASMQQSISGMPSAKQSPSLRTTEFGHTPNTPSFQDNDRSSTLSSVSTPYSQSNSASQIFEETSFFNQLSSNDSLTRGQRASRLNRDELSSRGAFATSPVGDERSVSGGYGLGLIGSTSKGLLSMDHHRPEHIVDLDDESEVHTENEDDDDASQDESGPLREQIKQLHLEDALAFLPIGSTSGSSMIQRPDQDSYQSRTAAGDRMPFQLDDELASLGTRALEEIHENDGGDEDDHLMKGIRFKDIMGPGRLRGFSRDGDHIMRTIRTSPERSGLSSRKSSAQNSVGSSFSDLSDSSVTRSALEDAYLSGYNNSKTYEKIQEHCSNPKMNSAPFNFHSDFSALSLHSSHAGADQEQAYEGSRKRKSTREDDSPLAMKTRMGVGLEQEIIHDRTLTRMMEGQRRLLEEQRQHEFYQQQQQQQQQELLLQRQGSKEAQADAFRRLFAKNPTPHHHQQQQQQQQQQYVSENSTTPIEHVNSFSHCAGELNGCETSKIPGMVGRYQAEIRPCSFCWRPQCQFCAVQCVLCRELSCRRCCNASYGKQDIEYHCQSCSK